MMSMVGSTTGDATPTARPGSEPEPFTTEPVDVGHVVVPLDGSPFAEGAGVTVGSRVVYNPSSVRDGLVPLLDRTAALVVLGSGRQRGAGRRVLGSHAARVVHDTAVPALVVPLARG